MKKFYLAISIFVVSFMLFIPMNAATFTVTTTNDTLDASPGDGACADSVAACSLRAAIGEANALAGDDTITLPAGAYTQTLVAANEDLNAGGDWDVTSTIVINGGGEGTTFLQAAATAGTATERVINIRAGGNLTLNDLTVRNGRFNGTMSASTRGAGIENNAVLTLGHVTVRDNQVTSNNGNSIGAGIHNAGTALTLTNSTVTANVNTRQVGGSAFGGGISSITAATIILTNSSISGNTAVTTATVAAFGFGAGLYLENVFNVTATNTSFNNNTGTGVLTGGSNGTGVRALSSVGAAVFNATNCTFNGNTGSGGSNNQGVGLQLFTSTTTAATLTATLDKVTVNGNSGNSLGVGLNATVVGGNMNLNVLNSTISGSTGGTNGGGMLVSNTGGLAGSTATVNITNSTLSGNSASGNGGGLLIEQPVAGVITANINFSTIANNTAGTGGGIFHAATGVVNMKNSIVGDNTGGAAPDISGGIVSGNYNHIENAAGATITGTTTNDATGDAQLGALAANGGPTNTHLPGAASPVLNTIPNGTNDCGTSVTTEQRGLNTRPAGGGCEKGSVEVTPVAAQAAIAGKVTTADGRGIRNVIVTLSGGTLPQPLVVQTGMFGTFSFTNIPTGQTYTLSVAAKRFTFTPSSHVINLSGDALSENFTANPGFGGRQAEDK